MKIVTTMKKMKYFLLMMVVAATTLVSCESLVDGLNDNPNKLTPEDVGAELFLTGAQLANIVTQNGHLNRIAGMYSGQLVGYTSLYSNIYGYNLSTVESNSTWRAIYVGVVPQVREIRRKAPDDKLLVGIAKVLEAHAIGTAASLFGNIPYSEVADPEIPDPKFDDQIEVFNSLLDLLDEAIVDLNDGVSRNLSEDIYYGGDKDKWIQAAYTLKARYYLQLKQYDQAYQAARDGIGSDDASMKFYPRGDETTSGDKNLFYTVLAGSRGGDIGNHGSYLMSMICPDTSWSRNNAKTNENARYWYYEIHEEGGPVNKGIIGMFEPMPMVTFAENQLILAECAARTVNFATALGHLNDLRAWLNSGAFLNDAFADSSYLYEAYNAADFASGGIENPDGVDPLQALLREIIEERYVSGFGTYMPFNDVRRLRKSDSDLIVPFPLNPGGTDQPQRLPYAFTEINANSNISEDPGLYEVTPVNR